MISSVHRPTKAIVNLKAISRNVQRVKEHIASDKKVFAVVKANAYGHGAIAVAQALEMQVDGFCVSNIDEAIELREAGVTKSILILGVIMAEDITVAKDYRIMITVASLEWISLVLDREIDLSELEVHLKIDSGMGRIGMRTSHEANQVTSLLEKHGAKVKGIFTHFATADEADTQKFEEQLTCFKEILDHLQVIPEMIHASNSATSLWHSETIFTAVRLGIVMYGLNPSGKELNLPYSLEEALSLESCLVHVKALEKGSTVGYGATYQTTEKEYIGTLPIGYADGFVRRLQDFYVLVDGCKCEIVGRVSMDQITIRLPQAYSIGTPAVLIGKSGDYQITATDIAGHLGTINYEVLCLLSDRIPRFYKGE